VSYIYTEISRHVKKAVTALPAILILMGLISGCAHHEAVTGFLYPGQYALEGYSTDGDAVVYEDNIIKIRARQIRKKSSLTSPLAKELFDAGYVLVKMKITNKSRNRLLYDPAITSLRDSKAGYFKPLDFTDLYMMKLDKKGITASLTGAEDVFYDLAERLAPHEVSSKLLVFHALTEKADEAELVMKSIYVGADILDLTFNFLIKPPETSP